LPRHFKGGTCGRNCEIASRFPNSHAHP
jgi:hypothetical protein